MKITRIRVRAVNIPLIKEYTISRVGTVTGSRSVLVELFTDQGLIGIGESDPELMFTGESQQTVMTVIRHHLGPAILGQDPLNLEAIHARMNAVCVGNVFAKGALDLACHDLWGKKLNAPLCCLFGGVLHPRIDIMWSLGSDCPEANVDDAVQRAAEGYTTIGLKLGSLRPELDVARVRAVRKAVGEDVMIRCDANQAWPPATAIATIRRLEEFNICMIEQPVPGWNLKGLAQVRAAVNVPVAVDEGFSSPRDALRIVEAQAADIFSIKTAKLGGLLPSRRAAAIIEAAGLQVFVNSMIEMGVSVMSGLNFAVSNPTLFACGHALTSVRRLQDDILKNPVPYQGTQVLAPADRVGLGCELDEQKMKQYTVSEYLVA